MQNTSKSYQAVQTSVNPVSATLQVDDSMMSLRNAIESHVDTVQVLLRRLEPVTGERAPDECKECDPAMQKVPLAAAIDNQIETLLGLTEDVNRAIRALQI